jgi:hypothetical protein
MDDWIFVLYFLGLGTVFTFGGIVIGRVLGALNTRRAILEKEFDDSWILPGKSKNS